MIIDDLLEFCDATALDTTGTGLDFIGAAIDLGVARDIGNGQSVYLCITVDTAVTSGGAATLGFVLASDSTSTIATDGSATEHLRTPLLAYTAYTVGRKFAWGFAFEGPVYERYLGILQNTGAAAVTAGKVNAFLTDNPGIWKAYAEATN
jgi:hypothetical protein